MNDDLKLFYEMMLIIIPIIGRTGISFDDLDELKKIQAQVEQRLNA